MSQAVACPQCGKRYAVKPELAGRKIKCPQCGAAIHVPLAEPAGADDDPLGTAPAADSTALSPSLPSLAKAAAGRPTGAAAAGPSDAVFRIGGIAAALLGVVGLAANHWRAEHLHKVSLAMLAIGPFVIFYGVAAAISPNVVRAAGKYGGHLPVKYKVVAAVVGVAALAVVLLLAFVVYRFGR